MTICGTKTFEMIICVLIRSIPMLFRASKLIFFEMKKVRNRVYYQSGYIKFFGDLTPNDEKFSFDMTDEVCL